MMLGEIRDPTSIIVVRCPGQRLHITSEELYECRFTRSIGSNDGYPRVEVDINVDSAQDDLFSLISEGRFVELE